MTSLQAESLLHLRMCHLLSREWINASRSSFKSLRGRSPVLVFSRVSYCSNGGLFLDLVIGVSDRCLRGDLRNTNLALFKLLSDLTNYASRWASRSSCHTWRIAYTGNAWLLSRTGVKSQAAEVELLFLRLVKSFVKVGELGMVDHSKRTSVGSWLGDRNLGDMD